MRNSLQVGQLVKQKRLQKGLTVTEFAKRSNLNKSTISRYENGSRKIPMDHLTLFASILDCSPQELLLQNQPETIAAHKRDDLTEEEQKAVDAFIQGLIANRKN